MEDPTVEVMFLIAIEDIHRTMDVMSDWITFSIIYLHQGINFIRLGFLEADFREHLELNDFGWVYLRREVKHGFMDFVNVYMRGDGGVDLEADIVLEIGTEELIHEGDILLIWRIHIDLASSL